MSATNETGAMNESHRSTRILGIAAAAFVLLLWAGAPAAADPLADQAKAIFGPLPDSAPNPANPDSEAKVDLGQMLYFDPRLSKNHDIACNSCHRLDMSGVDGEPTSPGHKGARGARNSPTTLNAALHFVQFWDGRSPDVEDQAKGPVLNPVEMAMPDAASVEKVLRSIPGYAPLFEKAFPGQDQPITFDNTALAIASFERRLLTPSRFDAYMEGDDTALTAAEKKGLETFINVGCPTCHMGSTVGGTLYQKLGLVKPYPTKDAGRYEVTKKEADRGFFKVPSLRNVTRTGPWFHDGSVKTLPEAVRLMARHQLGRELDDAQVASIVTFLGALEGEVDPALAKAPELPKSGPKTPKPDPS
jgi:cytochrome c peroxidase